MWEELVSQGKGRVSIRDGLDLQCGRKRKFMGKKLEEKVFGRKGPDLYHIKNTGTSI